MEFRISEETDKEESWEDVDWDDEEDFDLDEDLDEEEW